MKTTSSFALVLALLGAACSSTSSTGSTAEAPAVARTTLEGKFARYLVSPHGEVDGAILADGTTVRFPPHALAASAPTLAAGDAVKVEGEPITGPTGRSLVHATIWKGKDVVAQADPGPPLPRGKPGPGGPEGRPGPRDESLSAISWKGTIQSFGTDPRGAIDAIVFTDGSTARAGRRAKIDALGLKAGDSITVTGRGGAYPKGKSMRLESITMPDGTTRVIEKPPMPPAALGRVTASSTISQVLHNPEGDIDTLLLADGSIVKLPPDLSDDATELTVGASVTASGEGGTYGNVRTLRADRIELASGKVVTAPSPP